MRPEADGVGAEAAEGAPPLELEFLLGAIAETELLKAGFVGMVDQNVDGAPTTVVLLTVVDNGSLGAGGGGVSPETNVGSVVVAEVETGWVAEEVGSSATVCALLAGAGVSEAGAKGRLAESTRLFETEAQNRTREDETASAWGVSSKQPTRSYLEGFFPVNVRTTIRPVFFLP